MARVYWIPLAFCVLFLIPETTGKPRLDNDVQRLVRNSRRVDLANVLHQFVHKHRGRHVNTEGSLRDRGRLLEQGHVNTEGSLIDGGRLLEQRHVNTEGSMSDRGRLLEQRHVNTGGSPSDGGRLLEQLARGYPRVLASLDHPADTENEKNRFLNHIRNKRDYDDPWGKAALPTTATPKTPSG